MSKKWLLPTAALLVATMACQTILDPLTDSSELEPDILIEPFATEIFEELDPDTLIEPEATEPQLGSSGGQVLLSEDFSDPSSGWEVGDYPSGSVGYTSDAYFVISLGDSDVMWGLAYQDFDNLQMEFEATQVRAPANDNNGYGVMCRVQENSDGYILRVSGDGYYSIFKVSDGEVVPLVDWETSDAINLGNDTNRFRVICDGSLLVLEVNGTQLAATEDTEFSRGDIAFTATSFEDGPTEVRFDNLTVSAP